MDFLRSAHGIVIAFMGTMLVFWGIVLVIRMCIPEEEKEAHSLVNKAWLVLSLVTAACFGWSLLTMASVNEAPRSTIDRSLVEEQVKKFKNEKR